MTEYKASFKSLFDHTLAEIATPARYFFAHNCNPVNPDYSYRSQLFYMVEETEELFYCLKVDNIAYDIIVGTRRWGELIKSGMTNVFSKAQHWYPVPASNFFQSAGGEFSKLKANVLEFGFERSLTLFPEFKKKIIRLVSIKRVKSFTFISAEPHEKLFLAYLIAENDLYIQTFRTYYDDNHDNLLLETFCKEDILMYELDKSPEMFIF